jgi:hypothetical protein
MKFDHNDIPDREYRRTVMGLLDNQVRTIPIPTAPPAELRYLPPAARPVQVAPLRPAQANNCNNLIAGTDSQSVHNSAVQQSANKSLDYVLNYKPKNPLPEDIITAVINAYKDNKVRRSRMRRAMKFFSKSWAESSIFYPPIRNWCLSNDIHSSFGVTYKSLLKQVWAIIQDQEHKEELIDVLCQELDASEWVCFTGRFTRTLNALTGFIEEVQIGISSGEQMQNQITMAIKRWKDKLGDDFQPKAREEVRGILNEFKISEAEQEAWLDAIE